MILSPELSSVSDTQTVAVSAGVTAPVINKRSADTVVVTPNGETVIVGGLMGRQKSKSESKVPFLGDIPLIGNLFKRRITTDLKTELMIFLTPHIIPAAGQLSALNASELKKMPLTPSQLSQQELDQFLEGLPVKRLDDTGKPPKAKK